jgi:hypothetical protein
MAAKAGAAADRPQTKPARSLDLDILNPDKLHL